MIKVENIFFKKFLLAIAVLVCGYSSSATHIRAGEILVTKVEGSRSYKITVVGYRDRVSGGPPFGGNSVLEFGDGSQPVQFALSGEEQNDGMVIVEIDNISAEVQQVKITVFHQYSASGDYVISYREQNRNGQIANMSSSVSTPFYIETFLRIDDILGPNSSPILTVPPVDYASVGAIFIHNAGAFDLDGDSLSYRFITPRQAKKLDVTNYKKLDDESFYTNPSEGSEQGTPPTLTLNAITGDLIWNAPGDITNQSPEGGVCQEGFSEYNVAFVIDEWRKVRGQYYRVGYTVRDMQIIVCKTDNEPPIIAPLEDVCVEAGQQVETTVFATDPEGLPVKLEAFGGPFEVGNPATFSPFPPSYQSILPAELDFTWNTGCLNVRERPYEVQFKATDSISAGPKLVDFETFLITVMGPAPVGLETEIQPGRSVRLRWDEYACNEADIMQIWRKVGASNIDTEPCDMGMPPNTGFQMIDEVNINTTEYLDDNRGRGLSPGAKYCYRLVASYPSPGGGLSYVSAESCDSLLIDVPVITNVDVVKTDPTEGEIIVKWTPPYQIDQIAYPPTYTYDLLRKSNSQGSAYETVLSKSLDTAYTDTGLNTERLQYTYQVVLYENAGALVDSSASASSVWLTPNPLIESIEVLWNADVPWSLKSSKFPYHYIYRDRADISDPKKLVLIDSVDVTSRAFRYVDFGTFNDQPLSDSLVYCYFVSTNGFYDNALLPEPLINRSQIACAQPNDTIPPCSPPTLKIGDNSSCQVQLAGKPCDFNSFQNQIDWEATTDPDCGNDVTSYNVYFSDSGQEETFELIGNSTITTFIHYNLKSFKGCYYVEAVDRSGNRSVPTDTICGDNCPNISFPNAFSPNGDGINDLYTPKYSGSDISVANFNFDNCPRFIQELNFRVVDRSGNQVFRYSTKDDPSGDGLIRWDGKNMFGLELGTGVYYYEANVTFDVLNPKETKKTFKGWIQLMR